MCVRIHMHAGMCLYVSISCSILFCSPQYIDIYTYICMYHICMYHICMYHICMYHVYVSYVYVCIIAVCTDLWGKELHRQMGLGIVETSGKPTWCNGSTLAQWRRCGFDHHSRHNISHFYHTHDSIMYVSYICIIHMYVSCIYHIYHLYHMCHI